jgi:malate dehydrogenase
VVSDGSHGIPEGLVAGFPVTSRNGRFEIVPGLEIDKFGSGRIARSVAELLEEPEVVSASGLLPSNLTATGN